MMRRMTVRAEHRPFLAFFGDECRVLHADHERRRDVTAFAHRLGMMVKRVGVDWKVLCVAMPASVPEGKHQFGFSNAAPLIPRRQMFLRTVSHAVPAIGVYAETVPVVLGELLKKARTFAVRAPLHISAVYNWSHRPTCYRKRIVTAIS
jgi:hypothetical protein